MRLGPGEDVALTVWERALGVDRAVVPAEALVGLGVWAVVTSLDDEQGARLTGHPLDTTTSRSAMSSGASPRGESRAKSNHPAAPPKVLKMVREPRQRMHLSGFRLVGTAVGTIMMTALTLPLVNLLGGGSAHRDPVCSTEQRPAAGHLPQRPGALRDHAASPCNSTRPGALTRLGTPSVRALTSGVTSSPVVRHHGVTARARRPFS